MKGIPGSSITIVSGFDLAFLILTSSHILISKLTSFPLLECFASFYSYLVFLRLNSGPWEKGEGGWCNFGTSVLEFCAVFSLA